MQLVDALNTAITFAYGLRDIYAEGAARTPYGMGQRFLARLEEDTRVQADHLACLLREYRDGGALGVVSLPSLLPSAERVAEQVALLSEAAQAVRVFPDDFKVELERLHAALEAERRAGDMYSDQMERLASAPQAIFELLLERSRCRVRLLQAEVDALVGLGHWFDFGALE